MRRASAAAAGCLAGASLMVWLKVTTPPVAGDQDQAGQVGEPTAPPDMTPPAPTGTATPRPSPSDPDEDEPTESPRPHPSRSHTRPGSRPTPTPPPDEPTGTFRGTKQKNPYGTVQVTVTLRVGRITDVTATYPTEGHSGEVNGDAIPKLRKAVLAAQSADVDTVSGATYTSNGYRRSLQSALDAAESYQPLSQKANAQ